MSVYWRVLTIFGSFKKITILTQHSKEFWCIGLCTCCGSSSSFLYWGTFTRIWWWNCDGEIVVQLGQSWVSYRLVSAGSHMISSKIAQSLWIMSLGVSFAARNNTPGLSPDGKFQRCSVFQHVVVLTCERTFRTIEHQVSLNRQLSIRMVRNIPRFSTFWSPNKIPT